jgi:putative addiction module CopG family antidote
MSCWWVTFANADPRKDRTNFCLSYALLASRSTRQATLGGITSFAKVCYSSHSMDEDVMNVSLTVELEKYVRRKVASGLYNNASEVIREALRLHIEREGLPFTRHNREPPMKDEVRAELAALEKQLRERGLTSLALFGSVARSTARPDSDVDVLVDVAPDARFSLIDLVSVKDFLEDRLGRRVDVVTKEGLEPAVRDRVLREAEAVF